MFEISADEVEYSIGDIVICINDTKPNGNGFLKEGDYYRIVAVDELIYVFDPGTKDNINGGWFKWRFKKIKRNV